MKQWRHSADSETREFLVIEDEAVELVQLLVAGMDPFGVKNLPLLLLIESSGSGPWL